MVLSRGSFRPPPPHTEPPGATGTVCPSFKPGPVRPGRSHITPKTVLDGDAVRRALTRIAHEIAERDAHHGRFVIVGIHRRGVPLAARLAPLVAELVNAEVATGSLDIALYRDDLGTREATPVVYATEVDVDLTGATVGSSTMCSTRPHHTRGDRRAL